MAETSGPKTQTPQLNGPPFDKHGADIIIQSADKVDFRCHKAILTVASPVFESLFTLPQGDIRAEEAQIVRVPQDGVTLSNVLRFAYPTTPPKPETLDEMVSALNAAHYYQMDDLASYLQSLVTSNCRFLTEEPVRTYAIACRWGWKDMAKKAAIATLQIKLDMWTLIDMPIPELADIPAISLVRLWDYRRRCIRATCDEANVDNLDWLPTYKDVLPNFGSFCDCPSRLFKGSTSFGTWSKIWFVECLEETQAQLVDTLCMKDVLGTLSASFITKAVRCPKCFEALEKRMSPFMAFFAKRIDEVGGKVSYYLIIDTCVDV